MLNHFITLYRGELAALAAAFLWASASVIYASAGRNAAPLVLNLTKGIVAIAFMAMTLVAQSAPFPGLSLPELTMTEWLLLMGSGIIGIGIGDTAFFIALNSIGPRRTVLIEALAPPLSALLAIAFLGEILGWIDYGGIVLTVIGVTWVVLERTGATHSRASSGKTIYLLQQQGLLYGLLAALCQATGAVMSRAALAETSISPLWSGLIRLTAGTIIVVGMMVVRRPDRNALRPLQSPRFFALITVTAFGSTFLAIWLQQTALKYAETGVAQSLTSTSPLFVIPFAMMMGDRVSLRAVLGVFVALVGIWLLFQGH
ncbi:MAG: DMT family transporter [Merismopedia sp. SIO2A8]|nr:DMT family transporter [Merismopedia sp. SIO2A8]